MFHPLLRLIGVLTVCVLAAVFPSGAGAAMKGAAADGGLTQRAKAWFSASASKQPVADRLIVGGAVIPITSAPWQVNVWGLNGARSSECGGAILNASTIITAAHCVDDKTANADPRNGGIGVWAGISNINAQTPGDKFQERAVSESRIHPLWGGSGTTGDVAVLKLASPLVLDDLTAKAIALPTPGALPVNDPFSVGLALSASGYGHTVGGGTIDGPLRSVTMTVTDPDFCDIADNAIAICGSNPTGTTCQGDSGGPVVIPGAAPVLVGLVSNGPAGCGPGTKDNYVSLWAPENRAFVDGNNAPPLAPRLTGVSSIGGAPSMRVGETVTCTAATFTGNPTVWVELITSDGVVLRSDNALQTSFALTEAQVGKTLQCRSFGSNAGGVSISKQSISAPVVAGPPPSSCNWRESIADMTVWYPTRVRRGSTMRVRFEVDFAEPTAERFTVGMQLFKQGKKKRKWTYKTHTIGYARSEHRRALTIRVPRSVKLGYHRFQTNAWTSGTGADGKWALCDDMYVNFRTRVVR